ncbi:MAG: hypothetical protein K6T31_10720, partial [Alicyclobacillus sp.]|nr:hypothetical protein [Alicyclobacillus sp.]
RLLDRISLRWQSYPSPDDCNMKARAPRGSTLASQAGYMVHKSHYLNALSPWTHANFIGMMATGKEREKG